MLSAQGQTLRLLRLYRWKSTRTVSKIKAILGTGERDLLARVGLLLTPMSPLLATSTSVYQFSSPPGSSPAVSANHSPVTQQSRQEAGAYRRYHAVILFDRSLFCRPMRYESLKSCRTELLLLLRASCVLLLLIADFTVELQLQPQLQLQRQPHLRPVSSIDIDRGPPYD